MTCSWQEWAGAGGGQDCEAPGHVRALDALGQGISLTQTHSLTHRLTHSFAYSLTHFLSLSLSHSLDHDLFVAGAGGGQDCE